MGLEGLSIGHLLVVLLVVVVVFGTKRLRTFGGDLGAAVKNFRNAMREETADSDAEKPHRLQSPEPAKPTTEPSATDQPDRL